jgi:hypothetical protein
VSWVRGSAASSHTASDSPATATLSRARGCRYSSWSRRRIRRGAPSQVAAPRVPHPARATRVVAGEGRDCPRREPDGVHTVRCARCSPCRPSSPRAHGGWERAVGSASTHANLVERGVAGGAPRAVDLVDQRTPVPVIDRVISGWKRRMSPTEPHRSTMSAGAQVEVFSSFTASWVRGFEVASTVNGGYQVRRLSDHSVLPKTFVIGELRAPHS